MQAPQLDIVQTVQPNLKDYDSFHHSFKWEAERQQLYGLPCGKGLDILTRPEKR